MSKVRTDELESLSTGKSILVDEIDSGLLADLANPDKGAAMVARGVVAVDSIADLLALPEGQRKEGLRYIVKGYHAGTGVGGGEFYWDAGSAEADNGGTVIAVEGVTTGRWIRPHDGAVTSAQFGAYLDGTTDDTPYIQSGIDYLESVGGGTLYLSKGESAITSITVGERVSLYGYGRAVSSLVCTSASDDGAVILNSVVNNYEASAGHFALFRKDRQRDGVGVWMRIFWRACLYEVTVDGFDVGIDTQGGSWATKIQGGTIQYNNIGIFHHAASADYIKVTQQTEPYDRTTSGFNGGSVFGTEIRQNEVGVEFGDYSISGLHSTDVTYSSCIIEGNNRQGIITSRSHAVVNIRDCYFEVNARSPDMISIDDFMLGGETADPKSVAAHISSISTSLSGESNVNISGCYFQNSGSFGYPIVYLANTAVLFCEIVGNFGYIHNALHFVQRLNINRMSNIRIGENHFNSLFYEDSIRYAPRNSDVLSSSISKVSNANGVSVSRNTFDQRHFLSGTAVRGTNNRLSVTIPLPTPNIGGGRAVATVRSTSLSTVSPDKIFISRLQLNNDEVTVLVGHAEATAAFGATDTAEIDVYIEAM